MDTNVHGELDVYGRLRADRLEVYTPYGTTRFDDMYNEISGEQLNINVMDTNVCTGSLMYMGGLESIWQSGDFSESPEVLVPTQIKRTKQRIKLMWTVSLSRVVA